MPIYKLIYTVKLEPRSPKTTNTLPDLHPETYITHKKYTYIHTVLHRNVHKHTYICKLVMKRRVE